LLDRIDIHIEVPSVRYQELSSLGQGEPSAAVRKRVVAARVVQEQRFAGRPSLHTNGGMNVKAIQEYCALDPEAQDTLRTAITELNFSARAYDRILKVSRTIADLEGAERIGVEHVAEAIQYRSLDRAVWL